MHPQEIYKKFLLKVNKNDTNTNIKVPKGVFVLLFNEQKRKFLNKEIVDKESTDEIESMSELLIIDKEISPAATFPNRVEFKQPDDFLKRTHAHVLASNNTCKNNPLVVWFKKPKDINVLLQNTNQQPSFEYQETLGIINNGRVSVYKTNFNIDKLYLSYYFEPSDIDVEGYVNLYNQQSKDIETQLSNTNIDKIIDRVVVEVAQNYEDVARMQMAFQRQQLNER